MILEILAALFLAAVSYWYMQWNVKRKLNWMPHVPGIPFLGNALDFGKTTDILDTMTSYLDRFNQLCLVNIGPKQVILTSDYEFLKFLLSSTKIIDKSNEYTFLKKWLGTGLLTARADKWKKTRKIITPAFHFSILEQFVPVFEKNSKTMIDLLQKEVGKDSVDIFPYVTLCTLDIICETAMGVSVGAQKNAGSKYTYAVQDMGRIIVDRSFSPIKRLSLLYPLTLDYYKELKYVKTLHGYTDSVIKSRRSDFFKRRGQENSKAEEDQFGVKEKLAFLDLLLHSTMDGEPLSDDVIRQEVDTFMFEGHDTTASAISFTLYLLANHPEVQAKVIDEQREIFRDDQYRLVTHRDLMEMKYLELVIKESLRIYPSVPFFGRMPYEDMEYKGNIIPKGVSILMVAYDIAKNPKYFPNPEKFDPSRFEDIDGSNPYSYIPFSAGPRNCIGQKFAMLEIKSTVSKVLRYYEVVPASPKHTVLLSAEAVLRSANGVKVKLLKRVW